MRYLNKIIFLNSAHVPYAEVKLDGNVHFIGTQGVGKSTLLRAVLFFYNADKLRLGIPKEKKNFDSFYLPFANSYIVYEVMRENGAYTIVVTKSMGRAAFRFIDAPYSKEWFVDGKNEVSADWSVIRTRVPESEATYLLWVDCSAMKMTDEEIVEFWKNECGIMPSGGLEFGEAGSQYVRLNLACPKKILLRVLENMKKGFDGLKS